MAVVAKALSVTELEGILEEFLDHKLYYWVQELYGHVHFKHTSL